MRVVVIGSDGYIGSALRLSCSSKDLKCINRASFQSCNLRAIEGDDLIIVFAAGRIPLLHMRGSHESKEEFIVEKKLLETSLSLCTGSNTVFIYLSHFYLSHLGYAPENLSDFLEMKANCEHAVRRWRDQESDRFGGSVRLARTIGLQSVNHLSYPKDFVSWACFASLSSISMMPQMQLALPYFHVSQILPALHHCADLFRKQKSLNYVEIGSRDSISHARAIEIIMRHRNEQKFTSIKPSSEHLLDRESIFGMKSYWIHSLSAYEVIDRATTDYLRWRLANAPDQKRVEH
jgi:hypothetical protein